LRKAKKELTQKDDQCSKLQSLNQTIIKEVKNLKQESARKLKKKNYSKEKYTKKDEEIKRLGKHNQELLNNVNKMKWYLQGGNNNHR
jgi:hypothetical protein